MKARSPLFDTALCAVAGLGLADLFSREAPWAAGIGAAVAVAAAARLGWNRWRGQPCSRGWLWLALLAAFCGWGGIREVSDPARRLAAETPPQGRPVEAVGVVVEAPRSGRFPVRLEQVRFANGWEACAAKITVHWPGPPPAYGDRVWIAGSLRNLTGVRNPGGFDLPAHRLRQGIRSVIEIPYRSDARVLGHEAGNPLVAASLRLRAWMGKTLTLGLEDSPEITGIMQSMVLGIQGDSLGEYQPLFRHTGTLHLFAVSGLNVAMLAAMVAGLLRLFCVPHRAVAVIALPVLWGYCFVTGLSASSLRATVMASVVLIGMALERPSLSWNTLGAAALAILVWDPDQLFRLGFQLSFWMVVALLWWGRPVQAWLERRGAVDPFLPRVLWTRRQRAWSRFWHLGSGALAVSLVAWLASFPWMIAFFRLFSPSTVPANLLAGAVAWCMLALGLAASVAGTFWQWMTVTLNNANWLFTHVLLGALSALSAIPGSHVYVEPPGGFLAPVEITVLDLEGGGAIHLRAWEGWKRTDWLIDCGSTGAFRWTVLPYLRSRGINTLDGVILTHGDSRHLGGAVPLLEEVRVAEVIDGAYADRSSLRKKLHQWLATHGRGKQIVWRGHRMELAPDVTLEVVYPPVGRELRTADDKALVLRLSVGGRFHAMMMSDAGFQTEQWLLENGADLQADLLIKGKHAGDLSGTPGFLAAADPRLVVASSTAFPPQEQISDPWAAGVKSAGMRLFRQDRTGAVRIKVWPGGDWEASGFYDGSTFRNRSR